MKHIIITIVLLVLSSVHLRAQNVTIYIVDRDDFDFTNVTRKVVSQQEAETDYKTLVLVYDKYREEVIGGWGSYDDRNPTKSEFKKIVDDSIQELYNGENRIRTDATSTNTKKRNEKFDGVLGLRWGMKIETAINELRGMGLYTWEQVEEDKYQCIQNVSWDGRSYDAVRLGSYTTNRQNCYLTDVSFIKICSTANEAKNYREIISNFLKYQFGDAVKEEIGDNKFKRYVVMENKGGYSVSRINLSINKAGGMYGIILNYNGFMDIAELIESES